MLRRVRLVTLTGPAGIGKTRTAIELGGRQARQRADGVWLVDLASVGAIEDVAAEAARVLDIRGAARDAATDAIRYLADRDVLLLLDNCQHVLDACAELGMTLLGACRRTFEFWQPAASRSTSPARRSGGWSRFSRSTHTASSWSAPGNGIRSWFRMRTRSRHLQYLCQG